MVFEQHYAWGRAYRDGKLICGRVDLTVGRDERLGLTRHERRYVLARFLERLDPTLRRELTGLTRRRGPAARRAADRMAPIEIAFDDPRRGRQQIVGRIEPPQAARRGDLHEIEFRLREPTV